MAKHDKLKVAHRARLAYEWAADSMPSKLTKREKAKERQAGKKEIRRELNDRKKI